MGCKYTLILQTIVFLQNSFLKERILLGLPDPVGIEFLIFRLYWKRYFPVFFVPAQSTVFSVNGYATE